MPITTTTTGTQTTFVPTEILYDPTNKLRVAQPESLIDTDFEYGTQTTKWENLATVNNMPFAYPSANAIPNIVSMQYVAGSRQVIVIRRPVSNSGIEGSKNRRIELFQ